MFNICVLYVLGNGVGNACSTDSDDDGVLDNEDFCPNNPSLNQLSLEPNTLVNLDPSMVDVNTTHPQFRVNHDGKEVLLTQATDYPFILLGIHTIKIFSVKTLLLKFCNISIFLEFMKYRYLTPVNACNICQ